MCTQGYTTKQIYCIDYKSAAASLKGHMTLSATDDPGSHDLVSCHMTLSATDDPD